MVRIIHLVRHGHHALLGRTLCGRMNGVTLDEIGCAEMARCAVTVSPRPALIQSSPQRRCMQSACILAAHFARALLSRLTLHLKEGAGVARHIRRFRISVRWNISTTGLSLDVLPVGQRKGL